MRCLPFPPLLGTSAVPSLSGQSRLRCQLAQRPTGYGSCNATPTRALRALQNCSKFSFSAPPENRHKSNTGGGNRTHTGLPPRGF